MRNDDHPRNASGRQLPRKHHDGDDTKEVESRLIVTDVHFTSAPACDVGVGLLGFVDFVLNGGLKLSGLALRRTRGGDLRLSFPVKRNSSGQEHYIIRPIHDAARKELERSIIAALGHGGRQP